MRGVQLLKRHLHYQEATTCRMWPTMCSGLAWLAWFKTRPSEDDEEQKFRKYAMLAVGGAFVHALGWNHTALSGKGAMLA
jgi:hypothetical protein